MHFGNVPAQPVRKASILFNPRAPKGAETQYKLIAEEGHILGWFGDKEKASKHAEKIGRVIQ